MKAGSLILGEKMPWRERGKERKREWDEETKAKDSEEERVCKE